MNIHLFQLGLLGTNCYLLQKDGEALVIDPGGDPQTVLQKMQENNLKLQAILLTHAHFDHIGGVETLREKTEAPVYLHEKESSWLTDPSLNGSEFFKSVQFPLRNQLTIQLNQGTTKLEALHSRCFIHQVIHLGVCLFGLKKRMFYLPEIRYSDKGSGEQICHSVIMKH